MGTSLFNFLPGVKQLIVHGWMQKQRLIRHMHDWAAIGIIPLSHTTHTLSGCLCPPYLAHDIGGSELVHNQDQVKIDRVICVVKSAGLEV